MDEARPFDDSDTMEHLWARTSARLGMISVGLCMAAPCTCMMSYFAALPAAILTLWFAKNAYDGADPSSASRAYAKMGLVTGGTALTFTVLYFVVMAAYTAMWMGLIVLSEL